MRQRAEERAQLAERDLARRHLVDFATHLDTTYATPRHILYVAGVLERVRRRELKRVMLLLPPRHGKSALACERFPAWSLGQDPAEQFMIGTNAQQLANTFSSNVRDTINLRDYGDLFPRTRLRHGRALIEEWTLDGYMRPAMISLGVGSKPTGKGGRVLIVDDPIGNAEEAESPVFREKVYKWYTDTMRPRLEPDAAIIVIMQRWHEDDLVGRLIRDQSRAEKWHVVVMPAICESQTERDAMHAIYGLPEGLADPLGRAHGEVLWPERWPLHELEAIRSVSPRSFDAKYQQRPRPTEGSLFKRNWFKIEDASTLPYGLRWVRYYDLAYSLRQTADQTATISGAFDAKTGTLYLRRGRAARMETPEVRTMIFDLAKAEADVRHGIESELHGGSVVQDLLRSSELMNRSIVGVAVDGDKYARAVPVADRASVGKVTFVRETISDEAWIKECIDEMCAFPYGVHDDWVDAVSGVNQMLATAPSKPSPPQAGRAAASRPIG